MVGRRCDGGVGRLRSNQLRRNEMVGAHRETGFRNWGQSTISSEFEFAPEQLLS